MLAAIAACSGKISAGPGPVSDSGAVDGAVDGMPTVMDSGALDSSIAVDAGHVPDATAHDASVDATATDVSVHDVGPISDAPDDVIPPTPGSDDGGLCTAAQLQARWAAMVAAPVVPLVTAASLPEGWTDAGSGISVQAAQQINCQCQALGNVFGQNGITTCSWGNNSEVLFTYFTTGASTDRLWMLYLQEGYVGVLGCNGTPSPSCKPLKSPDGTHTYVIPLGSAIQKDNQTFEIDWLDPVMGTAALNELGAALLATYGPQFPQTAACLSDGQCIQGSSGNIPYLFIPQLGFAMSPASESAAQPVPSIMTNIQLYGSSPPITDAGAAD
jgi:hypothetical protein